MELRKGKQSSPSFRYRFIQGLKVAALVTVIFCAIFGINQFRLSHYFPITTVRVYGLNHIDQKEVQGILLPLVAKGFFSTNVDGIRDRLLQLPWANDVAVRRQWPNQIEIMMKEKNAVASWNNEALLSETGILFLPKQTTYPASLPMFVGPSGKHIVMLNYFNEINRILMPLHVKISYLELTSYLTWKVALSNGIALQIGHKDVLTRLYHFVKVYPKIIGKHTADVDSIDLRYPNGIAVRWKSPV